MKDKIISVLFLTLLSPAVFFAQGTRRIERGTLASQFYSCPTGNVYPSLDDQYLASAQSAVRQFFCNEAGWIGASAGSGELSKPVGGDAIRYVSPAGNDSDTGSSWALSKLTLYNAICSLPGGNCSTQTAGSGTVYVASGSSASPISGCGIWLMGPSDPHYASPPTCWLKTNGGSTGLDVIGIANTTTGPNGHKPRALIVGGGGTDTHHPGLDLSANESSLHFQNLSFGYAGRAVVIGECSDFATRTTKCQSTTITLDNVGGALNQSVGSNGPCTDITGASFWIYLRDYGCTGMGTYQTGGYLANGAAAILIDGTSNYGPGLIFINDSNSATGGIKVIPGSNGFSVYVDNFLEEGTGNPCAPAVWFTGFSSSSDAIVKNVTYADCGSGNIVENDGPGPYGPTIINSGGVPVGPAYINNSEIVTGTANPLPDPTLNQQTGFMNGYLAGKTDVARRIGGLTPTRYANLAYSDPSHWRAASQSGGITVTTGQTDPFGGTQAARISVVSGTQTLSFNGTGTTYSGGVGGWVVAGVWVLKWGYTTSNLQIGFCPGNGGQTFSKTFYNGGQLQNSSTIWEFIWTAGKVATVTGPTCMNAVVVAGDAPTFYGPVLFTIPNRTLSDSEVLEYANSMNSQDASCVVGDICNIAGHPIYTKDTINPASVTPSVIYSAAGTALPPCTSSIKGEEAVVSDAVSPTYLGAYTSGGTITAPVVCSYNGRSYSWVTY